MSKIILGVQLQNRLHDSTQFQNLLSKYGSVIQTRIGLHETASNSSGLIILDFADHAESEVTKFEKELSDHGNVKVQKMVF